MTSPVKSGGSPLSSIFDPYAAGTTKARATGIYENGVDICNLYANIIYGSAASATGIKSQDADVNTLFAKIGTAVYSTPLPIDGHGYNANGSGSGGTSVRAQMNFQINTSGWTLVASGTGSSPTTLASGAMPSTATTIAITDTWLNATGDTAPGTVINTCSSSTAIPTTGTVGDSIAITGTTSGQTTHSVHIVMKNSAGSVVSDSTFTATCATSNG